MQRSCPSTLSIPAAGILNWLLTVFTSLDQHFAQAVNLLAFIPTSIVALIVHIKNKMVDGKHILIVALPATVVSVGASFLSKAVDGKSLGVYFGLFLGALGVYQLISCIISIIKSKKGDSERAKNKKAQKSIK